MRQLCKLFILLCSAALLVSSASHPAHKHNGRETRLNGRFKSHTGNWCAWTEKLSDDEKTVMSVACLCIGKTGQSIAYTCDYVSQGDKLFECRDSRRNFSDVYDDIGSILSESGDGCGHEELNLDTLNSQGQPVCPGAVIKRNTRHYPGGHCVTHDEL